MHVITFASPPTLLLTMMMRVCTVFCYDSSEYRPSRVPLSLLSHILPMAQTSGVACVCITYISYLVLSVGKDKHLADDNHVDDVVVPNRPSAALYRVDIILSLPAEENV